jgi:hypothetical protein
MIPPNDTSKRRPNNPTTLTGAQGELDPPRNRGVISRSGRREAARGEVTAQLALELSDYSVQDIAQTVRSTLEPLAADKKLAFKVEMPPELPPGRGDGRR